jgi:hypothetical protein
MVIRVTSIFSRASWTAWSFVGWITAMIVFMGRTPVETS